MCLAALGSQTGGSITRPAAFCGIVGCKPTCGRVPLTGVYPLAPSLDHPGPFARSVRDLALLLNVLAGHDASDPRSSREAAPDLLGAVDASSKPPRIGRLRGLFETDVEDPAIAALDDALGRFTDAGATVAETSLPESFAEVPVHHRAIMYSELAAVHDEQYQRLREHYAPGFASQIEEGFAIDSSKVEAARAHREALCAKLREIFERVDILACPAATGPAPTPETTGNPAMNIPWSYTGLPTITFPLTLAEGLPLGIQLVGPAFGEGRLFSAAAWCERAVSG
jgi:aspartyl-tRNA(Asn)/glutamyl-tRNA(Gln) amidotransferase subunit A